MGADEDDELSPRKRKRYSQGSSLTAQQANGFMLTKRKGKTKVKKTEPKLETSEAEGEGSAAEERDDQTAEESSKAAIKSPPTVATVNIARTWNSSTPLLELLRVIRSREEPQDRKIQLAFDFVETRQRLSTTTGQAGLSFEKGLVPPSHFVGSLSEWVQTLIISASKGHPMHSARVGKQKATETSSVEQIMVPAHLDERYWAVLKWCLFSGIQLKAGFISLGIMQALSCVLDEVSIVLSRDGLSSNNAKKTDLDNRTRGFTESFFPVLLDVVKLLLCAYEGSFRPKLDLWVSSAISCLKIASIICARMKSWDIMFTDGTSSLFQLTLFMCRGFVRFLKSSPNPRKVFQAVVEKLLESLLSLFADLSTAENRSMDPCHAAEKKELLNAVEDILKYSLFHPSHIGGYLNVCRLSKQAAGLCNDAVMKEMEEQSNSRKATFCPASFLSYHKLLFQKLYHFVKEGKALALGSVAWIFKTYIQEFKAQEVFRLSTLLGVKSKQASKNLSSLKSTYSEDQLSSQGIDSSLDHGQGKKVSERSDFFAMFAELVSPLLKDFEVSESFCFMNNELIVVKLIEVESLLTATNNLLVVAKEEHVYVPTEDTPTLTHLSFLKTIYTNFIHFGISLPKSYIETTSGNRKSQWSEEVQCLLMAVIKEVILGIGHILELEYRVLEHNLQDIWMIIFSAAALQFSLAKKLRNAMEVHHVTENAVILASRMMEIFGELRQIDHPVFSLCDFMRHFTNSEHLLPISFQVKLQRKALESLFLSPDFLATMAAVMKEVPEGQIASFMRLLSKDMEETLKYVEPPAAHTHKRHQMQQSAIKVLTEIYICILEHENVTASNSIQVGMLLRALMDGVVSPLLGFLVDSTVSGGNIVAKYANLYLSNLENDGDVKVDVKNFVSLANDEDELCNNTTAVLLSWEFNLRLYMSIKRLHRQCVSLMPSKLARKASTAINDPTLVFFTGEFTRTEYLICKEGFFSCARKGAVSVLDVLCGIEQWLEETGQKKVEPLQYTLHCIAVHSLADLKRQIKAVDFLLDQTELSALGRSQKNQGEEGAEYQPIDIVGGNVLCEVDRKDLQKHCKKLKRKASSLISFLIRWITNLPIESKRPKKKKVSAKGDLQQDETSYFLKVSWNKVVGSLDNQTLPVARWGLLCQSIDVWSEFASKNDLKTFGHFMLGKTIQSDDELNDDPKTDCNAISVTRDLLEGDSFYEQKALRGVLLEILCQEVEHSLSMSEVNLSAQSSINYIETQVGNVGGSASRNWSLCAKSQEVIEESEDFNLSFWDLESKKLAKCVHLMNLVSRVPKGYIETNSAATLISFILMLERSIVVWLLNFRNRFLPGATGSCTSDEASQLLHSLELLLACRRSLESLLLRDGLVESTLEDSCIMSVLLQDSCSMYWPVLSMVAVATCIHDLLEGHPVDAVLASSKDILFSLSRCTTGLFTFFSQNLIKDLLNPLLMRSENGGFPATPRLGTDDPLMPLVSTLVSQLKKCSELMKLGKFERLSGLSRQQITEEFDRKENSILQECPYGVFALLGAVSSLLWGVTMTLESFDEKCHSEKDGCTKWSGQIPDGLLSFIETIETFLTDCLHEILLADEEASNRSASVEMTSYLALDNGSGVHKVSTSQDGEDGGSESEGCLQDGENHSAGALADVDMEASEVLASQEHNGIWEIKHQEHGDSDNDDAVNNEDSDDDATLKDSVLVNSDHLKKTSRKMNSVSELSAPNVIEEQRHAPAQAFADFSEMVDTQVLMFREMVCGKLETLSQLLGELYMAMAAIVRLKSLFHSPNVINPVAGGLSSYLWTSSMSLHVGAASKLLQEAAMMSEPKGSSWLILMLGVIKYLESVGSFLPHARPMLSPTAFVKLINTQMMLHGAFLSRIQIMEDKESCEELKVSLQSCFTMFMKKPLGLHFHLALQTIERSLLGLEGRSRKEDSEGRASFDSMKLNTTLVAGVEYLSISLDAVSGLKRLQILSRYSSRYLAAIFNYIINSQTFWHGLTQSRHAAPSRSCARAVNSFAVESLSPLDTTVAIWKCVDILVSISSREVIFPMKANHVAQAMSCPADFFKPFYQRSMHQVKLIQSISSTSEGSDFKEYETLIPDDLSVLNVLLEIYTACCKLLRNLLRHRKRESGHCVALLGESLRALLFFLEVMELSISRKQNNGDLNVRSATHCASWLRRVYEEIAEHKETLGTYFSHLLSDYICIISGYGMTVRGLCREIEGTLRPGAYALVDACSGEDLQQLHAVLGEGPRRSALTALRRDYERHYKYMGKV